MFAAYLYPLCLKSTWPLEQIFQNERRQQFLSALSPSPPLSTQENHNPDRILLKSWPSHSSTILKWRFSHFFNLLQHFGPWINLHFKTLIVPYWLQRELKFGPVRKCSAIQIVLLSSQHGWLHGISSQHYCSLLIPWLIIWQKNHPKISTVMYIPPPDPQQDYGRKKSIVSPLVSKGKT